MKLLLDTTVLVDALRGRGEGREMMAEALRSGSKFVISVVSVMEIYAGLRSNEESRAQLLFETLDPLPVTETIAKRAGEIIKEWRQRGTTLAFADVLIASTALEHGLPLMTSNRKDFPMAELALFPPQ